MALVGGVWWVYIFTISAAKFGTYWPYLWNHWTCSQAELVNWGDWKIPDCCKCQISGKTDDSYFSNH